MIDAEVPVYGSTGHSPGNSASSDYTTVVYETGVGKGATITPAKGDTDKTLFVPNAGQRDYEPLVGTTSSYGIQGAAFASTLEYPTEDSRAYYFRFSDNDAYGIMSIASKLYARSLRCVRS